MDTSAAPASPAERSTHPEAKLEASGAQTPSSEAHAALGFWADAYGSFTNTLKSQANGAIQLSNKVTGIIGVQVDESKLSPVDDPKSGIGAWCGSLVGQSAAIALELAAARRLGQMAQVLRNGESASVILSRAEVAGATMKSSLAFGSFMGGVLTPTNDPNNFWTDRFKNTISSTVAVGSMTGISLAMEAKAAQFGPGIVSSTIRNGFANNIMGGFLGGGLGEATSKALNGQLPDFSAGYWCDLGRAATEFALIGAGAHGISVGTAGLYRMTEKATALSNTNAREFGPVIPRIVPVVADEGLPSAKEPKAEGSKSHEQGNEKAPVPSKFTPLPEGTIERLHDRVQDYLNERHEQVNLGDLKKQLEKAETDASYAKFQVTMHHAMAKKSFDKTLFRDEVALKTFVKGDAKAQELVEEYLQKQKARDKLNSEVKSEYDARAAKLTEIINEEASSLYPNAMVPKLKVQFLDPNEPGRSFTQGSYSLGDGTLQVSTNLIDNPRKLSTGTIAHEIKHAEQDATIIWKLIDQVAGSKQPQAAQQKEIRRLYEDTIDYELQPDLLKQVIGLRTRKQTPQELERADNLIDSIRQLRDNGNRHTLAKSRYEVLDGILSSWSEDPQMIAFDVLLDLAERPKQTKMYFGDKAVPDTLKKLLPRIKAAEAEGKTPPSPTDEEAQLVHDALIEARDNAEQVVLGNNATYRSWLHEEEAGDISRQAAARLNEIGPLSTSSEGDAWNTLGDLLSKLLPESIDPSSANHPDNVGFAQKVLDLAKVQEDETVKAAYNDLAQSIVSHTESLLDPLERQRMGLDMLKTADELGEVLGEDYANGMRAAATALARLN